MLLVERYGGAELYVPIRNNPENELFKLLGEERFVKLSKSHGGKRIAIVQDPFSGAYKGQITALFDDGLDDRSIALKLGCTQRYVRRVLSLLGYTISGRRNRAVLPSTSTSVSETG